MKNMLWQMTTGKYWFLTVKKGRLIQHINHFQSITWSGLKKNKKEWGNNLLFLLIWKRKTTAGVLERERPFVLRSKRDFCRISVLHKKSVFSSCNRHEMTSLWFKITNANPKHSAFRDRVIELVNKMLESCDSCFVIYNHKNYAHKMHSTKFDTRGILRHG